jgi:hypothetical protein
MSDVVPYLSWLRSQLAAVHSPVRVVLVTRVREPLSFYLSFFKWKVSGLQRQRPELYGRSFSEWAPPHIQAFSMLHGNIDGLAGPVRSLNRPRAARFGAKEMRLLSSKLARFDVVAPLEYFDEQLLLLADLLGLPHISYQAISPPQMGMGRGERVSDRDACPNVTACRELVHRIAPWDRVLYTQAVTDFKAKVVAQPPSFHRRLALFRASRSAQPPRPRPQDGGACCDRMLSCLDIRENVWKQEPAACVPGWRELQNAVIRDRGGVCCVPAPGKT